MERAEKNRNCHGCSIHLCQEKRIHHASLIHDVLETKDRRMGGVTSIISLDLVHHFDEHPNLGHIPGLVKNVKLLDDGSVILRTCGSFEQTVVSAVLKESK